MGRGVHGHVWSYGMNPYHRIRDFHGARLTGIGSSDIPTLAGFGKPYKDTPYTLWLEKTGRALGREAGPRAEWGHRLEPVVVAKWIETIYGVEAARAFYAARIRDRSSGPFKVLTEARIPERSYVLAHADLIIDSDAPALLEAKTTGFFSGKRREGEAFLGYDPDDLSHQGIPDPVYLQVQWQLLAYGIQTAYVAVLIDTGDYREYGPIMAAPRVQEKCLALAERLWWHVEHDKEPKPETWSDVAKMWPVPEPKTAMVGGDDEMRARECAAEYWRLGESIKALEARRDEYKNALGIYIGENGTLVTSEGMKLATSSLQRNPPVTDLKRLREEQPGIYTSLVEGGYISQTERRELRPAKIKGEL